MPWNRFRIEMQRKDWESQFCVQDSLVSESRISAWFKNFCPVASSGYHGIKLGGLRSNLGSWNVRCIVVNYNSLKDVTIPFLTRFVPFALSCTASPSLSTFFKVYNNVQISGSQSGTRSGADPGGPGSPWPPKMKPQYQNSTKLRPQNGSFRP